MLNRVRIFNCWIIFFVICLALLGCAGSLPFPYRLVGQDALLPAAALSGARSTSSDMYVNFRQPTALSVRDGDIYLVDKGLHRIFRYDSEQKAIFTYDTSIRTDAELNLFVAADKSLYIANPKDGEVLHFSYEGMQLPSLRSPGNVARPNSVISDDSTGIVVVADGSLNQIVMFDSWGSIQSVIKPPSLRSISAIATGPDGIYVLDAIEKQIIVLDRYDGSTLYSFSVGLTEQPYFLTVSRNNLIFVGDKIHRSIHLYQDRNLVMRVESSGESSNGFASIDGMVASGNQLYVSDGVNARVQVLQINQLALGRESQNAGFMEMSHGGGLRFTNPSNVNTTIYQ